MSTRVRNVWGVAILGTIFSLAITSPASAQVAETVKIHRLFNPSLQDHLPTYDPYEASPAYSWQGSVRVYSTAYGGAGNTPAPTNPIYRCRASNGRHYANGGSGCSYVNEGRLGYALRDWRSGHVPLYQCKASGNWHYFPSTDVNCEGWANHGFFGYVLPDSTPPHGANLSVGPDTQCLGRCGAGCNGWMPMGNIYTSECRAHDECVLQNGQTKCLNGKFVAAAISYSIHARIQLALSVADKVKSLIGW